MLDYMTGKSKIANHSEVDKRKIMLREQLG